MTMMRLSTSLFADKTLVAGVVAILSSLTHAFAEGATHSKQACAQLVGEGPLTWRAENLAKAKSAVQRNDADVLPAYYTLLAQAEKALKSKPYTVTDKNAPPPGGDLNDYWSLAPYWWPDPVKSDGLPYIRKDGETNPARNSGDFDRRRLQNMRDDVIVLSLAAYFSSDKRYAQKAQDLLDVWFINQATRMRPSLRFAQSIPGRTDGRAIGIIDTRIYMALIDSVLLLETINAIDAAQIAELRQWFGDYVHWLTTNPMGLEERSKKNNHGTFYDAQVTAFALFAHNCALAARISEDVKTRIASQITPEGEMPHELKRTRSFHYSVFSLDAFFTLARLNEHLGEDLYSYTAPSGASIINALQNLAPYAEDPEAWPYQEIGSGAPRTLWQLLRKALTALESETLATVEANAIARDETDIAILTSYLGD